MAQKDDEKSRKRHYFGRIDEVKQKLADKLDVYVELHEQAARNAAKRGDASPVQWLMSHVSVKDEGGVEHRPISASVDKDTSQDGAKGPAVQILIGGFPAATQPAIAIKEGVEVGILPAKPPILLGK